MKETYWSNVQNLRYDWKKILTTKITADEKVIKMYKMH